MIYSELYDKNTELYYDDMVRLGWILRVNEDLSTRWVMPCECGCLAHEAVLRITPRFSYVVTTHAGVGLLYDEHSNMLSAAKICAGKITRIQDASHRLICAHNPDKAELDW